MTATLRPLCLLGLVTLVALGGCREPSPIIDLPDPPWADPPELEAFQINMGSQGNEFRDAAADLESLLRPVYVVPDGYGWWTMPVDPSKTWADVDSFYTAAFARPPLSGYGFVRRELFSPEPDRYEFALWSRPGRRVGLRTPADEVLVVLFVPPLPGSRFGVLAPLRHAGWFDLEPGTR